MSHWDIGTLTYIITHVCCPLQLPDGSDYTPHKEHCLATSITAAARLYSGHVGDSNIDHWRCILRMLENLQAAVQSDSLDRSQILDQFSNMDVGDILSLCIQAQNAGLVFRKQKDVTVFESFELSPKAQDVKNTQGKLICSYPGPAIEIPNDIFRDMDFLKELVDFLIHMNVDHLHPDSRSPHFKDTVHPRYITELLTGILRSLGRPADVPRISKRVGDEVVENSSKLPWRRSSLWLLIRVALQTTLGRSPLGCHTYKEFMLFFMSRLAKEETCTDLPSDLLHFMAAKISRRLRKLGSSAPDWLLRIALDACDSLRSTIENRWGQVQDTQHVDPPWAPSQLDLTRDIELSLSSSGNYLSDALDRQGTSPPGIRFQPTHTSRGALNQFLSSYGATFKKAHQVDPRIALYDLECVVERDLDAWVGQVTNYEKACVELEVLADEYSLSALEIYANNPELLSVMLLTMIELWVALDKLAIKEIPMLADYSPEIPTSLLENLFVCKTVGLDRLRHVHEYLSLRHSQSREQWSVFSSTTTADSFAVRFYRDSARLQQLKTQIEEVARREVSEKVAELEEKNTRYAQLQRKEAEKGRICGTHMEINVYEWPLPTSQLEAEVVVFELDCPVTFNVWRSATVHLLVDICSPDRQYRPHGYGSLGKHQPLKPYFVKHPRSRVTHYVTGHAFSPQAIPAKEEKVCVNNMSTFQVMHVVSDLLRHIDVKGYCTYKLPTGRYQSLQKYINSVAHPSNHIIANQADCHEDLSIHEYMAFGHLRSGGRLQWLNILRELRSRSLSFRRPEVHMLLSHAVSQVGPLADGELSWHQEIQHPTFCYALLGELRNLIRDVETNWMEGVTMDTASLLLRRLLASRPDDDVTSQVLDLLRAIRTKVFAWIGELFAEFAKASGDPRIRGVLRDAAAICRSTFDIDPVMIPQLVRSKEDSEVLLSSAILIHDLMPNDVSRIPTYSRLLLDRDRRTSLVLESFVTNSIQADPNDEGINLAIQRVWPDYHPGSRWNLVPNSPWFSCSTSPPAGRPSQEVHFNTLDGTLLINGRPLGARLPKEFVRHPVYKLIFGEETLEVFPGNLPGIHYSTRRVISNHRVYFSLRNGTSDIVIRAKQKRMNTGESEIIELIPQEKLKGDLPAVLIEGHAHWLNISTSIMEIRPLNSLWVASSKNWRIDCTPGYHRMWRDHEHLVDIRSQSWNMVSRLLRPLCSPEDLIVSVSSADSSQPPSSLQLSVYLPRYDLSFFVDADGDLQSRDIRGMVYDENQSIGTLFGLVNRLVLRSKIKDEVAADLIPRCVVIPDGEVKFQKDGHHARVEINPPLPRSKLIAYHTYRVNTDLGSLTGSGNLTSKLYCAFLHALTSGWSADPLTGRLGTEEALSMLRSASCWSTVRFGSRDTELLELIASICPSSVWNFIETEESYRVPAKLQSHALHVLCKAIKDHYERVQPFHESQLSPLFKDFPSQIGDRLSRSMRRVTYLFPSELSRSPVRANCDAQYTSRDLVEANSGEHRAYTAATYVYRRTPACTKDLWEMVQSWKKEVPRDAAASLRYDKSWLGPDLRSIWLETYNLLRENDERKWSKLIFSLPAMAYGSPELAWLVPVFVALASHSDFRFEDPPDYDSYVISDGCEPSSDILRNYVVDCAYPIPRMHTPARRLYTDAITRELLRAWPCDTSPSCSLNPKLYDVVDLKSKASLHFSSCFRNLKLKEHFARVQTILNGIHPQSFSPPEFLQYSFHPSQTTPSCVPWMFVVDQLFARSAPLLRAHDRLDHSTANIRNAGTSHSGSGPLHQLIATLRNDAENQVQVQYVSALQGSAEYLNRMHVLSAAPPTGEVLMNHYAQCRASCVAALRLLQEHLGPESQSECAVERSGQWPRITAYTLLRFLASNSPIVLSEDWKRCLITFALVVLELQRARRLLLLHFDGLQEELGRELQNQGCDGWNAEQHPDWLLMQLQGNFLIRRVQVEVANQMISPLSGENTSMQLNMGEGKSSVIVPIAAAVLANGDQLVRVIVPKPLAVQTLDVLADRLGGLTNRRIYHLSFSRSLEISPQKVASLRQIMLECMQERGVLVLQPEHVLSLKLVSVERQLSQAESCQLESQLLELQVWLHRDSRDILDESDEILDVRSQLAFTIGLQQHLDGSPERWTTTQQVLDLVSRHASSLRKKFPTGVECIHGPPGSFPYLRILQADAGQKLISWVVKDVLDGLLPNINFGRLHSRLELRDSIQCFISRDVVPLTKAQLVKCHFQGTPLWGGLLLLRGLLASNILLYALRERRWRVDYGLAQTRTMLAVPYRAKDIPAPKAEFNHQDIAIILTCLSYYYGGLSEGELRRCFNILLKQQDPSSDYHSWVQDCSAIPESLQTFSGINMESTEQWKNSLFPLFFRNRATINFYLSRFVFPTEVRDFHSKLSSSGWDLAEKKERIVTGFSGTNDGQYLLPSHMFQRDAEHQRGTNAKVLSQILRPENNRCICMTHKNDEQWTTREFLQELVAQEQEIHVLLDVGAQMLDLQNLELAQAWLEIKQGASAAIYFNKDDELMVCTRDGSTQFLRSSPFAHQLDRCIVYLDDAHTRGTDIKFPSWFRAAVTLGPKVTKDRLAQGCMRMRKLGDGQSIMFFMPLEVDRRIRSVSGMAHSKSIDTTDILRWAIRETWESIYRWTPHWVRQGIDHKSRYAAWSSFCSGHLTSKELSDKWLQPEAKSLEALYEPHDSSNSAFLNIDTAFVQRCTDLGIASLGSISLDEEQERELIYEIRREREVERPKRVPAVTHSIHPDVVNFVQTGDIPTAFCTPVFKTLNATSAATNEADLWSQWVMASKDFVETVEVSGKVDNYLRPVHWVVSVKGDSNNMLIILSPHEANYLLPDIRSSGKVHLHLFTPRITKGMKSCSNLSLYSVPLVRDGWAIPSAFTDQLSVFAGELYLKDYETYIRLCRFLGMYTRDLGVKDIEVGPDGFILLGNQQKHPEIPLMHTFRSSPSVSLRNLMNLRCKGFDFTSTHMGKLLSGQLLDAEIDFNSTLKPSSRGDSDNSN